MAIESERDPKRKLTGPRNQAEFQTIIRTPVARVILRLIADPPPIVKTHTRAAVSCGELDTRVFQRVLNLGEGLNSPCDRAIAAFHALHGDHVNAGPLGADQRRSARRANLVRGQRALNSIKLLQVCCKKEQNSIKLLQVFCKKQQSIRIMMEKYLLTLRPPVTGRKFFMP